MKIEPISLALETTNVCNAKCSYCPNSVMTRPKGFMVDDIFEKIVKECKEIKTLEFISIQVLGEPTLDNKLYDRIVHIRKELPKVRVCLITNGTQLTKEIVSVATSVDISFNFATKKEYEEGMGLNFEKMIDKIDSLSEFRNKIAIHFVLSKNTTNHFEMLKELFKGFNVGINPLYNSWRGKLPDNNAKHFSKRIPCSIIHFQQTILWNGDVVPCCIDFDGEYLVGNVKDKTLLELFNSDCLNQLRNTSDFTGTFCENCNYNVDQQN